MKNKIVDVVFKKFQSYSFIIFLVLILAAFFLLAQLSNSGKNQDKPVDNQTSQTTNNNQNNDNLVENEVFQLPVNLDNIEVARDFYNVNDTEEQQEAAIVQTDNYFFVNTGINYTVDKNTDFDVSASLSGTVTRVSEDELYGWVVEIEHLYGVNTVYRSLSTVTVAVGDLVDQGDIIGKSGSNNFDVDSGNHVHFEILNGDVPLDPEDLIGTSISQFNNE